MIRPRIAQIARRWSEPLVALLATLTGLWLASWGGWFFAALGLALALAALAWLLAALRRLPFRRNSDGPGIVEIDEGVIRYFGARLLGGEIALRELTELRLLPLSGQQHWRLKSRDGQALLIPLNASGADSLADALAALPGIRMGEIASALHQPDSAARTLWLRPA
ncbi:hypothetical protein [Paracoccus tegillarcae]|uniref:Uncharacterized protein n=1 Tax=Paracoccus tegillarcae TaxID=1529068 RepID=A0A2K9EDA5_9RHOB|nr:hypothetical protein [Paracoccus tegillarcae]AUH32910.1 hypothetical protein CUV01_05455 [Paracoccus tegillarcae]